MHAKTNNKVYIPFQGNFFPFLSLIVLAIYVATIDLGFNKVSTKCFAGFRHNILMDFRGEQRSLLALAIVTLIMEVLMCAKPNLVKCEVKCEGLQDNEILGCELMLLHLYPTT